MILSDTHEWLEILTLSGIVLGALLFIARGIFMTRSGCKILQEECNKHLCRKIDGLSIKIERDKEFYTDHITEVAKSIIRIETILEGLTEKKEGKK